MEKESVVVLYLNSFRELSKKERDVLMDAMKLELTPLVIYEKKESLNEKEKES